MAVEAVFKIALITDDAGWHADQLTGAFARGGCRVGLASLTDCEFSTRAGAGGWLIPGFDDVPPDGVFVRGVPGGSLEQVVFYLDVLHAMERLGVPVYNDAGAIERSVDKVMTSFLLKRAGVPTPDTCAVASRERALNLIDEATRAGKRLIVKPVFGSQGKGLQLAAPGEPPPELADESVYYLQDFVDGADGVWHDWRLFVVGGRAIAAMERVGRHWINNVAQGSECRVAEASGEMQALAVAAVEAIGMAYAGVDLMRDAGGAWWVTEVNSIPAWKGLQSVSDVDVADALVCDFMRRLGAASR